MSLITLHMQTLNNAEMLGKKARLLRLLLDKRSKSQYWK